VHAGGGTGQDGAMPKFMGWIPFVVFVVAAAAGSAIGLAQFYA